MTQPPTPDPAWPTMADRPGQWPIIPAAGNVDPLQVQHRKMLAPEPLPAVHPDADAPPPTPPPVGDHAGAPVGSDAPRKVQCPHCGASVNSHDAFCENCGSPLRPTSPAPSPRPGEESPLDGLLSTQADIPPPPKAPRIDEPVSKTCAECQSVVGPDGYCTQCGAKAPLLRDHFVEQPSQWVGGCCDRGIRHTRNEDAMALFSLPEPAVRAALVVCDGVSSSDDSDVASLAAAQRARDVLAEVPASHPDSQSRHASLMDALNQATAEANAAVIATTPAESTNAASCTMAAALVDHGVIYYCNVGDSRVYWLPDACEHAQMLSQDHSVAQARIEMGVDRQEAENGPQAHAVTKWLGKDSQDPHPRVGSMPVEAPGWLMVCSDGLWNYCSEPVDLAHLTAGCYVDDMHPVQVAERLVLWANQQGGRDNISVALARFSAGNPETDPGSVASEVSAAVNDAYPPAVSPVPLPSDSVTLPHGGN